MWYLCVCRGSKYFKIVSDSLILDAGLYGTILVGRPLRTQFDDIVVLAVVFFALLSRSIGFQIFKNSTKVITAKDHGEYYIKVRPSWSAIFCVIVYSSHYYPFVSDSLAKSMGTKFLQDIYLL